MTKLSKFRFFLFEFCQKLAEREAASEELAERARELSEREGLDYKVALFRLAEERPWLISEPSMGPFGDPNEFLATAAERIRGQNRRYGRDISEADALAKARERFPQIAILSDLIHANWELFQAACAAVGKLHPDFARPRVEELILREAERLREGEG